MLKVVLEEAIKLSLVEEENVVDFGGPTMFYHFNREFGGKVAELYDEVSTFYKIPSSYLLLKDLYQLFE